MATFTKKSISLDDNTTFPAEYRIDGETVIITATTPDGKKAKIELSKEHQHYAAALATALEVAEGKTTRGPVPEKDFIGTKMEGPDWKIVFGSERTRIIFKAFPCKEYREAVKAAGFYWSPKDKSWNKKATFKAYRAAQAVHDTLWKIRDGKAA